MITTYDNKKLFYFIFFFVNKYVLYYEDFAKGFDSKSKKSL